MVENMFAYLITICFFRSQDNLNAALFSWLFAHVVRYPEYLLSSLGSFSFMRPQGLEATLVVARFASFPPAQLQGEI